MRIFVTTCLVLLPCMLFCQVVRYVSPGGFNMGECENPDIPCETISYALQQAESADTIRISEGIFTEPVGIVIDKSIFLLGSGDSVTIIQAHEEPEMAINRVITIHSGTNVTISGTTIRHGYADNKGAAGIGAGIYCDNAILVLEKVRFNKNNAKISGGGLACVSSSVTLSGVVFEENSALAQSGSGGGGGGIFMRNSTGRFSNVRCEKNTASWLGFGGGVFLLNCLVTIDSSGFFYNDAQVGGGLFFGAGSIILSNSVVSENTTTIGEGGGIFTLADTLIMKNVTVSENFCESYGGGISISRGCAILTDVKIRLNRALSSGGGIDNSSNLSSFKNVVVDSNTTNGFGGGMYHDVDSPYTLAGVTFRYNEASTYGGGFCNSVNSDSIVIRDVDFEYNQAPYGGGLYLFGVAFVEHCVFFKNHALVSGGGLNFGGVVNLSNLSFFENTSIGVGGGLSASGSFSNRLYPRLSSIIFKGNSAGGGGGMSNNIYSYPSLESVIFDSNSAEYGGGFHNTYGTPSFSNVLFYNNSADYGGGLYNLQDSISAINTLFFGNRSSKAGGAIFNSGHEHVSSLNGKVSLINVTMSQNESPLGGGVYNEINSRLDVLNSVLWNNIGESGKDIYNDTTSSSSLNFSICSDHPTDVVIGGGSEMFHCLQTDPLFVNVDEDDYRLASTSPGIDHGDPNTITGIFPGGPGNPIDYEMNPRIIGPTIDIGAFEWQGIVSLEESDLNGIVSIYPNPASKSIFISGKENIEGITIFNSTGQIVFQDLVIGSSERNVNISTLIDGLYIVTIVLEKSQHTFKIVKHDF